MALTKNQRTTNAVNNANGRYVQGGLTDSYRNRLGWWERFPLEKQTDDLVVTITKDNEGRPDLVSFMIYKRANLMWLVLQYNNIVDINTEFVVGKRLVLPTPQRVQTSIMSQTTGGNKIT